MESDFSSSRAILIGNGSFSDGEHLPPVPAVACVAAMSALLSGDLCGWPKDRIVEMRDVRSPSALATRVVREISHVHGILLVYYVGHGIRTREGQLALAVGDTVADRELLPYTAMLYQGLADILKGCAAATKLVILDCCHAELANKATDGLQSADLADIHPVDGLYSIFASRADQVARFPIGGDLTYFTEAFIDTVRGGIPGQPAELRLEQVFDQVRRRLTLDGLPGPVDSGIRDARQFPFARNAAYLSEVAAGPADANRLARLRILGLAEQAVETIKGNAWWSREYMLAYASHQKAVALLEIAKTMAADDSDRSRQLMRRALRMVSSASLKPRDVASLAKAVGTLDPSRAQQIASAITDQKDRDAALADLAKTVALASPARAGTIARAITDPGVQAWTLVQLSKIAVNADPACAEEIASAISDPKPRAQALVHAAKAIAASDAGHAQQIAEIVISLGHSELLGSVAAAMAPADPGRAESLARSITGQRARDHALEDVAFWVRRNDPALSERIIGTIADHNAKARALYYLASVLADSDPERAEQVALTVPDAARKSAALAQVAEKMRSTDPERARQLLAQAQRIARDIGDRAERDCAVKDLIGPAAKVDGDVAVRIAGSVSDPEDLSRIAETVAGADVSRAEQVSRRIADGYWRANALVGIAEAALDDSDRARLLDEAEKASAGIADLANRSEILARIAMAVAADDTDRAMRLVDKAEVIARTIPDAGSYFSPGRDHALKEIVMKVLWGGPDQARRMLDYHAERIARDIPSGPEQAEALTDLATKIFADDPGRAERAVLAIGYPQHRVKALVKLAGLHSEKP